MRSPKDLIQWLDLTRLVEGDSQDFVLSFCKKAQTPLGNVAAVCVYSEFVKDIAPLIADTPIKLATVCNFPDGTTPIALVTEKIADAILCGADEIDVVMPYYLFTDGKDDEVLGFLQQCRQSCGESITLKVIIESGELSDPAMIKRASDIVIAAGGDFIKTSTGKTAIGATKDAVTTILTSIQNSNKKVGIKISGGIRDVDTAFEYVDLISEQMGEQWLTAHNFRIGASSLLDDILATHETSIKV